MNTKNKYPEEQHLSHSTLKSKPHRAQSQVPNRGIHFWVHYYFREVTIIINLYKVTKWILAEPEDSFIQQIAIEHQGLPGAVLGIKIILRARKLIDSEIYCKLLSKQQFFSFPFRLLHYYSCNSSFDLLECIFLIWLKRFIWGCSVVTNIPKSIASHWSDVRMMTPCTQDSSLTVAAVR